MVSCSVPALFSLLQAGGHRVRPQEQGVCVRRLVVAANNWGAARRKGTYTLFTRVHPMAMPLGQIITACDWKVLLLGTAFSPPQFSGRRALRMCQHNVDNGTSTTHQDTSNDVDADNLLDDVADNQAEINQVSKKGPARLGGASYVWFWFGLVLFQSCFALKQQRCTCL